MYTHRTSGVVHGVKRYCYLFLDRLLQDVVICSRRGLASKTHSLISHPAPAIAMGSWLLILMSFVMLSSLARTPEGWAPAPRRPALWLSLSLPGGSRDFQ